ncbi:MAG: tannase/feruloyl esterase family alpha/beta hydrolase, partial [Burkholderiales bacterium]|nr:tannase/feruloyl esterase family alpha/beta hydrolase [Burkholderiales bacterium]
MTLRFTTNWFRRTWPTYLALCCSIALTACGNSERPALNAKLPAPLSCTELAHFSIPANAIGLPTSGAQVDSTEQIPATGAEGQALAAYCKVIGSIYPVDANAPPIRFQLNLPSNWNQKTMMFGGGGFNGVLASFLNVVHGGPTDKLTPQGRGYAVFSSDSGHTLKPPFIYGRDASFATNDEALRNFAFEALKKTRDAVQPILQAHYRAPVQKAYFFGGSSGGREAMVVTQRWPQDYDGVIALFPVWNFSEMVLQHGRMSRAFAKPNAYLNQVQRKLLYDTALANCDQLDGVVDGIISNVNACNQQFDPDTASTDGRLNGPPLRCASDVSNSDSCLNAAQISALKTMGSAIDFKFTLASGETQYPGFNVWG